MGILIIFPDAHESYSILARSFQPTGKYSMNFFFNEVVHHDSERKFRWGIHKSAELGESLLDREFYSQDNNQDENRPESKLEPSFNIFIKLFYLNTTLLKRR